MTSLVNSMKHLRKKEYQFYINSSRRIKKQGIIVPNSFYEDKIILKSKPEKKTLQENKKIDPYPPGQRCENY